MENIEYHEKVKYRIWELMQSQNYDTLDQLCQDAMGCFPDLVYEKLGEEIRKEFSSQKTSLHLSEYSLPEPNLADYEWRFTRQSVEDLINHYEIRKENSVALLGVPTLFFYLEKLEKNVTLYDINELFSEKNHPNIITIDLSRNEIPADRKYDCVIMDPPWYMTDYRNWICHASHILNKGGRLITTLFQPLLRPDANEERNQILNLLASLGEVEIHPNAILYETPFFERELFGYTNIPINSNWRKADLIEVVFNKTHVLKFVPSEETSYWKRYLVGNQTIALRFDENSDREVEVNYPFNADTPILKSISRRYPHREQINLMTSRNKGLIVKGQYKIDSFIKAFVGDYDKKKALNAIGLSDTEKRAFDILTSTII